ncbi:hypothetical protein FZ103_19190 [Streptomonospora sp. PA3]|uniref:hypothetical protein n=1 Tax=Streptomonospora sp. PA3 TaxID=2607326 RepID=UPI0012DEEE8B|nr:hypothetical protein [Streptomonospora sp. PA3]MUL43265.1 hypothetical protein [Streptomonospora sp. PA3]
MSYSAKVSGPVRYLPVELGGEVIGYLYAGVRTSGASFIRRLSAQDVKTGFQAARVWSERLEEGYAARLPAEETLRRWIGAEEHPIAGAVPRRAEFAELGSYEELRQLANPDHSEPPVPPAPPEPEFFPDGTPTDRSKGWGPLGPFTTNGPGYKMATDSAVRYLPAYRGDVLLGYLWVAETDDAAGFVPRAKARADGHRAERRWIDRMREAESQGLPPSEMLRSWIGAEEDPKAGRLPSDAAEQRAESLDDLRIRARD